MNRPLRIALTKGRLEKDTVGLLEKIGYDCTAIREKGRKLILPVPDGNLEVVLAKANDVITYVEHGVCDMGVVGKDTIMECRASSLSLLISASADVNLHLPQRKAQSSTADLMLRQLQQNTLTSQEDFLKQREWTLTSSR